VVTSLSVPAVKSTQERVEYFRGSLPAPPVVLLPGLFAGSWIWKPAWDHLTAIGYSVLQVVEPFAALDTKTASIEVLRRMLIDTLDEHGISQAVLCGNSLGGLVALDAARHHPDRVKAMVISGCPGLRETPNLGLRRSGDMSRQNADCIADQLFYDRSVIPKEMIEKSYAVALDRRCAINMLRYVLAIRKYDVRECLARIRCDVSMIWGEHDRIAPVEDWEENLHLIAHARLQKLARCGHSPMIERPAEFNAILTEFMLEQG
jgi:2-hydroxy-6-oxonona-2,4-dienedioate hydrolase